MWLSVIVSLLSKSAIVRATLITLKYERAERLSLSEADFKIFLALMDRSSNLTTWWEEREAL